MDNAYQWVDFYESLANRLLEYNDKREELFNLMKKVAEAIASELNSPIQNFETSGNNEFFCPIYSGNVNQYDCDEISFGVKNGWIPNDGLPLLMDIETILRKRELCLACERYKK